MIIEAEEPERKLQFCSLRSAKDLNEAVHVDSKFCFGSYNFGFNFTSGQDSTAIPSCGGARVVGEKDGCVNFEEWAGTCELVELQSRRQLMWQHCPCLFLRSTLGKDSGRMTSEVAIYFLKEDIKSFRTLCIL